MLLWMVVPGEHHVRALLFSWLLVSGRLLEPLLSSVKWQKSKKALLLCTEKQQIILKCIFQLPWNVMGANIENCGVFTHRYSSIHLQDTSLKISILYKGETVRLPTISWPVKCYLKFMVNLIQMLDFQLKNWIWWNIFICIKLTKY